MTDTGQRAVIVLAAGAGTRMKSKTPKILHEIGGRSLVGHALAGAAGIDPDHLIAVVSHERERVTAAIGEIATALGHEVLIAEQDEPLGTGDAARAGLTALPGDFDGTVVITVAAGPRTSGPTMAMVSSRLGTACEKTETEIPRYPSTSAAPSSARRGSRGRAHGRQSPECRGCRRL